MSERQWLHHKQTGGYFHCPVEAVDGWRELGWEPSEAPPSPVNPAIAENLAWREAQAQAAKPAKSARHVEKQEK